MSRVIVSWAHTLSCFISSDFDHENCAAASRYQVRSSIVRSASRMTTFCVQPICDGKILVYNVENVVKGKLGRRATTLSKAKNKIFDMHAPPRADIC